ncbi:MAG: hypothetical protein JRI25_27140, partial [Deltaproteobacteria bacterium]|nr:hypothetical protein [Deltaproteobacteria bacterium]
RELIHYDIPWNPNRMEQRNGRIDRHGQPAEVVRCRHFTFEGREDFEFLRKVVSKVETMRHDLGAVGDVIAAQVEEAMLGRRRELSLPQRSVARARSEVRAEVLHQHKIRELQRAWKDARRELGLSRAHMKQVVEEALRIEGQGRLEPADGRGLDGRAWRVRNLPSSWSQARAALLDREGRLLEAVFDEADARDRDDVVLIHLDHPLMKRSLAVFRANLWSSGLSEAHKLRRVSFRVLADANLDRPVVVAFSRLVCVGKGGNRLHEELFLVGGEIDRTEVDWLDAAALGRLLDCDANHPAIPTEVGLLLRKHFPAHERALLAKVKTQGAERGKAVRKELRTKANADARLVRTLIDQRIREIRKNVQTMEVEQNDAQVPLWPAEQREQHQTTLGYLRRRLDQLREERATQPEEVKRRYELRAPRAFPMALLYLLPASLVQGGGR